jgi:hypothetical protein
MDIEEDSPSPSGRGQGEGLSICLHLRPSPGAIHNSTAARISLILEETRGRKSLWIQHCLKPAANQILANTLEV